MNKLVIAQLFAGVLACTSFASHAAAAEVCKVSMMGRVCYEEGAEGTSSHMKGDAVAQAEARKKVADKVAADNAPKKVAEGK